MIEAYHYKKFPFFSIHLSNSQHTKYVLNVLNIDAWGAFFLECLLTPSKGLKFTNA